ncbi:hypothetical protein [Halobaculum sp. D14]|uniref:hypothetical protein n=1 Tax=Halobaculum sp. D14 TaxID=3421642 RepID=UPI003EB74D9A
MKRQYKAALGIGGIVLVTVLVGLGVFLYFGSQLGVYVLGVGVPVVIVASIGLYVRGVVTRSSTSEGEFLQDAARSAADSFRAELTTYNQLRSDYPQWRPDGVQTDAEQLADDFADAGVDVDVDAATFTVRSPDRVQEFDRLSDRVGSFAADRDDAFRSFAEDDVERSRDAAATAAEDFLGDDGTPVDVAARDVPADGGYGDAEAVLQDAREQAATAFGDAVDRIERTVEDYDGDADRVREELDEAERFVDAARYDDALAALRRARQHAEGEVSEQFSADREALENTLSTIDSVGVDGFVSDEHLDTVRRVEDELASMDSALAADDLDRAAADVRSAATAMIRELESDLERHVDTIRDADVPMGFYTAPPAVATDYAAQLDDAESLEEFRSAWLSAASELTDAVEAAETKAAVAESYPTVRERIDEGLRSSGRVGADDLPVRDAEPFLELYADAADDVEFDPNGPAVVAAGGGESYSVELTAQLAASTGEEHDLTLRLDGDGVDREATASTYVAATETFDDVPYGEYTVSASTPTDGFTDATESVRVDADRSVELTLPERSLREQVCGDDAADVEEQLPTVAPELESKFDDDEYLTPETDLPIADDYVPCLLVLWAEQEGHTATLDDGDVLVYDHDQFRSRLETIIDHNLTDGDSMTFDEMRTKFLSVPASDDLVAATIRELDADVTVGDAGVTA